MQGCSKTVIPDDIKAIGDGAFGGFSGLVSIDIPEGVESIGDAAFWDCENLVTVHIPSTVKRIGDEDYFEMYPSAFEYCGKLASISVAEENPIYDSRDNSNALILTATNKLVRGCASTVIPEGITEICDRAFSSCEDLREIIIPNTVKVIGYDAFQECYNITSINFPNSVETVSEQSFANCRKMESVCFGKNVKEIGERAFINCSSISEVWAYMEEPFSFNQNAFSYQAYNNATLHVPAGTKARYEAAKGWKNFKNIVEFVKIDPVSDETTVSTDNLSGQDLTDNVVGNVYYNLSGSDSGYDADDGSIVIGGTTNMGAIENKEPGTSDVAQNFDGLILRVAKGSGTITVNAKTVGNAQLVVQVGKQTPMIATKNERGDVVVSYNVTEDSYVYIYAIIGSSNARSLAAHRIAADNAVKIYSVKVAPGASGINATLNDNVNANDRTYDLQGRRVEYPANGIYIRNGRKVVVK